MTKFQGNRVRNNEVIRVLREAYSASFIRSSHLKVTFRQVLELPERPHAWRKNTFCCKVFCSVDGLEFFFFSSTMNNSKP